MRPLSTRGYATALAAGFALAVGYFWLDGSCAAERAGSTVAALVALLALAPLILWPNVRRGR